MKVNNIYLPIGTALIPVESKSSCGECFFADERKCLECHAEKRPDGKDVIYKLTVLKENL